MDRDSRRLSHQKGSKIKSQLTPPLASDGEDGDQIMVGSTVYTKNQGRWFSFKSGSGNINDGWHGSQKYVKILPKDFYLDNEAYGNAIFHYDQPGAASANKYDENNTIGITHPAADGAPIDTSSYGMACSIPIPYGYWAIAVKIHASHTWGPSVRPVIVDTGGFEGTDSSPATAGVKIAKASLVDGSSTILTSGWNKTNTRIVLDNVMLGSESSYLYILVNAFFDTALANSKGPVLYGGYVELRRVKTSESIAEGDSGSGETFLPRSTGG